MDANWQTWVALGIVAVTAVLLVRTAWKRRHRHEGCGCAGAANNREFEKLKKRIARS